MKLLDTLLDEFPSAIVVKESKHGLFYCIPVNNNGAIKAYFGLYSGCDGDYISYANVDHWAKAIETDSPHVSI